MPPATDRTPQIAHVLFMDAVAFSQLPTDHQMQARVRLQQIVGALPDFHRALKARDLILHDTGDGMWLAFFGDLTAPISWARQIAREPRTEPQLPMRMGIHTGPVYVDTDLTGAPNLAGDGINIAKRVMDCGDAGHILVSRETAYNLGQISSWKPALHDLGEVEVKHGVRVHIFNVYAEEFGNSVLPAEFKRARQPAGGEPNRGRLVAKLCDRRAQESAFSIAFGQAQDEHGGCPQLYFIPGEEGQCHESLVERLIHCVEQQSARHEGADVAGGRAKKIPWQHDGEVSQRASRLVYSLFENLGPASYRQQISSSSLTATALDELLRASRNTYIAIQHPIHAARWDPATQDLIQRYVDFWSGWPRADDRPAIVVFLSIVFPKPCGDWWKKVSGATIQARMRRQGIQSALEKLEKSAKVPCKVLAELPRITREDVDEWFELHQIYSPAERMRALDRLFPGGGPSLKPMAEVEEFCAEVLRSLDAAKGDHERGQWQVGSARAAIFG